MDYEYINVICEAYFNDRQIYKYDIFKSIDDGVITLQNEMKAIVQNLRLEDLDLYYDLQSHDKLDQQKIMYMLLDSYMISEFPELIEEGVFGWLGDKVDAIPEVLTNASVELFKFSSSPLGLIGTLIGVVLAVSYFKGLTKTKHLLVKTLHDIVLKLTHIIEKVTVNGRVKNAILNTHLEKCAGKCGLGTQNPWREMSKMTTFAIKSRLPVTEEAREQAECFIECYLNYILEQIKTVAESYMNCLKATGELPSELSSFSLLQRKPMGEECQVFYKPLKEIEKEFEEAVGYIFDENPRERQNWMNKFNSALLETLKVNQRQSFKPQQSFKSQPPRDFKQRNFKKGQKRY